jgi:hypothetical protein
MVQVRKIYSLVGNHWKISLIVLYMTIRRKENTWTTGKYISQSHRHGHVFLLELANSCSVAKSTNHWFISAFLYTPQYINLCNHAETTKNYITTVWVFSEETDVSAAWLPKNITDTKSS